MPRPGSFPIEFAVTPRFDVFYALYSLTSSAPTQIDSWKDRTLGLLPSDFDGAAKQVAPLRFSGRCWLTRFKPFRAK
jgi:hypothetical protein